MGSLADDPIHAELDALLAPHHGALGADATAYIGHVHRMAGLVLAQEPAPGWEPDARGQLVVAAVFHDLGIWLDGTFDYLDPSAAHAADHLRTTGRDAWISRVDRMIQRHHQLRPIRDDALVEAFRRADLADLTFGRVRSGIPRGAWRELRGHWPVAGFQKRLAQLTVAQARQHPLKPLPMLRW
ncbi:MAG: hypothetical protein J7513_18595 [Solirubrobacteraceae bacterium]|nr:hypothetical protein [Solirubrobacteraceae bacterium]